MAAPSLRGSTGAAIALALAALTFPSALFAQEHQYPQYPTNNVPAGRPAAPALPPDNMRPRRYPLRPVPRPTPGSTGHGPHHGYQNRPVIYLNGADYLQTPAPHPPQPKPKHTATPRPANAPDVFDTNSTK